MEYITSLRRLLAITAMGALSIICGTLNADADITLNILGDQPIRYSASVDIPIRDARQRLLFALTNRSLEPSLKQRYRSVYTYGTPLFPNDAELGAFEKSSPDNAQISLTSWLRMPTTERQYDLWISA